MATYRCINTSNQVRTFASYAEAYRFVMREGDASRLWSLERVS
jgi:hypothetical protein